MIPLLLFWFLVLTTAAVLAVLREVVEDDPTRSRSYTPPRSHPVDPFEITGSTYR